MTPRTPRPASPRASLSDALATEFSPAQIHDRPIDRAARAHDASHYLLRPAATVTVRTAAEVAAAMQIAARTHTPVTFRAGGTSLSGQASGDGLLIDTRTHFRDIEVLDAGLRVRCGPGATVRAVNTRLAPHARKLGPDPASEVACTVGGVVANNSSGMTCGTDLNAYATVESMVVVLASGTTLDTGSPDADAHLRATEPELYAGLLALRDRVRSNPHSVARVRHLFSMKNTMGYGINSFLDFDSPVAILEHLFVGSEGTLGFIASVTFRTAAVAPEMATGLLVFPRLTDATDALEGLLGAGARTLELMDAGSLRVVQPSLSEADPLRGIQIESHTALLVEMHESSADSLADAVARLDAATAGLPLCLPAHLTSEPQERAALWKVRKGLYTAVAGARPVGTTALLEDVVVPVGALSATTTDLAGLFTAHGYDDAVVFGHAKDGNLHFMITPRLDDSGELRVFETFTGELVDLILAYDGSLKAEHGTGRVMAPFVRRQYGDELYAIMVALKGLFDPTTLLNPGVIIADDPRGHLIDLKVVPAVDPRIDACVECGYCEPVCPSKDITVTPRQRIALMRTMASASPADRRLIDVDFGRDAVDLCAADSLCVTACPVGIDTGKVMKTLRAERNGPVVQEAGAWTARHWGVIGSAARVGLAVAEPLPKGALGMLTSAARALLSDDLVPQVGPDLPGAGLRRRGGTRGAGKAQAVFFPSCVGAMFAPERGEGMTSGADEAFVALCERAGVPLVIPEAINELCCGTVWQSKGLVKGYRTMAEATFAAIWHASQEGVLPVVSDAASCTHGLRELGDQLDGDRARDFASLRFIDAVTFTREVLLDRLTVHSPVSSAAVHPTCSTVHLGIVDDLVAVAQAVAGEVYVPSSWGCCGFAGDRGLLHPELTASATREEVADLRARESDRAARESSQLADGSSACRTGAPQGAFAAYVSANRTCELGMSRATGKPYVHILQVVERATRPERGR